MVRGHARWRLGLAAAAAGVAALVTAGLLPAAERTPAMEQPRVMPAAPEAPERPRMPGGPLIAAPESGAQLRGVVRVQVEWPDPMGYVMFRVNESFAYATTAPFEMRWDTSTAPDGEHVVRVDAYDASARYAGSSSIRVVVRNAIDAPAEGVLLSVRYREHDALTRRIRARGELGALRSGEALPAGFEVLAGDLQAEVTQSVLDTRYEGVSALVRNRLRTGSLTAGGTRQDLPGVGQYAMVQISRNGLTVPTGAGGRPRVGLGEISTTLPDYPVVPGEQWQGPVGVVCDLYTQQAIFVPARHVFEGLRWFQGRECGVITSSYRIAEVPLYDAARQAASAVGVGSYRLELTQMGGTRGTRMRGGMAGMGMRAGGRAQVGGPAGMGAIGAMRGPQAGAVGRGAPGAPAAAAAPREVSRVRLTGLEGTRQTFVAHETGRVVSIQDTILGKVEFRAGLSASAAGTPGYRMELTQMAGGPRAGGMGMRGGIGMRGGMAGRPGTATRGPGAGVTAPGQTQPPGTAPSQPTGTVLPPSLDYGFELTSELTAR